ncbi:protein tyrosine kinase [Ancylostoma duodenale]|uniref:glucuronosyltransferase n=2 Tax=Ancylostoma duodenale TaxID=51022 RepID=A0A0C2G9H4_9BILA|nr:protein tyrosine kinase [Ancylostoma duodenale]
MPELLYPPAPRTNDYFSYGSYCKQGGALPKEFEDFVSDPASRGTIVVAFGTLVPWYAAPAERLRAFVEARSIYFCHLETINNLTEYRVVWSYNGNTVKVGSHVMMSKWIPQNDLLLHNKTVLFLSHGGLKSVKEAACSGTPSLFMPMFAEQMRNAWLAKNKGYAEILNKFELSYDYLEENIRKVLNDPKYQSRGKILKKEAMLMRRLVHPNVVMLIGVASNEEPVMIVMEFAQGGSVLDAVQAKPGPTVYVRIKYCHGAALGLQYLSGQGIIHRDVAARNCLIGKHDTAKISDFGLSIVGTQKKEKTLRKVPVRYLAPETLKKREYTVKTDVWSFGVFMWEVFHDGKEPYAEMNAKEVRKYVLGGNTLDNESDHYPQHMWSITMSCFARDPQSRPAFDSIAAQIWSGIEEFKEHNSLLSMLKFW